jgi:pimeloyl-ACP methyl ester carboxylesterase
MLMPAIALEGRRLFYSDWMDADVESTLLLIHGAGGSHEIWPESIRRLPGARVIALDLPGHGESDPPGRRTIPHYALAVEAFVKTLELANVVLAGHSMGGAIAATIAMRSRCETRGLVLMGTSTRMPVSGALLGGAIESLERAADFIGEHGFAEGSRESKELTIRLIQAAGATTTFGDFLACSRFDLRPHLSGIKTPALVMIGTADRLVQPRFIESLAQGLPHARPVHLVGTGHYAMLERPEETAAHIRSFLAEHRTLNHSR